MKGRDYYYNISRFQKGDQQYIYNWANAERCSACSEKITGKFQEAGKLKYHEECFKCLHCRKPFQNGEALGKDRWGGVVHLQHLGKLFTCDTCLKFFRKEDAHSKQFFPDGRKSCKLCLEDGVFDLGKLFEVQKRVLPILSGVNLELPQKPVGLHLVDRPFLDREASKIGAKGNLNGLTLTKYEVVRGNVSTKTCLEHRIFILYGLPYAECISVLAREYGHVWLNERFIDLTLLEKKDFVI